MTELDIGTMDMILRRVGEALRRCDPQDFDSIRSGNFRIEVRAGRRSDSQRPQPISQIADSMVAQVVDRLKAATDREHGLVVLDEYCTNKAELLALAQKLDLPVRKKDSIERLREIVIESTIGFRLRSKAIQGKSESGGSQPASQAG